MTTSSESGAFSEVDDLCAVIALRGYLIIRAGTEVSTLLDRLGNPGRPTLLRSVNQAAARAWSLSGRFGCEAFPWHTDGAISSAPPRWIALRPLELSARTGTELLEPGPAFLSHLQSTVLLARDRVGRARYLPAVVKTTEGHRLRWDPRTCTPQPAAIAAELAAADATATVEWHPDRVLVFDNHRLLHRRPAVPASSIRVLERTYIWSD